MFSTRLAFHAAGLCAATLLLGGVATATGPATASADEDVYSSAHCATSGNHICGPGNGQAVAGCYTDGHLDIAWGDFTNPRHDLLWGRGYTAQGRYQTCDEIWDASITQVHSVAGIQDFPGGMYVTLGLESGDVTITCFDGTTTGDECNAVEAARLARL